MAELLAPAGDMEKLKTAVHFGANAVYLSGKSFGLRAFASNFTTNEIAIAVKYCHERGVKVYVTVNIYAKEEDLIQLPQYLMDIYAADIDAVLVSDPGIIQLIHEYVPKLTIHLSTQANTTNSYAVKFWSECGVKRIVLARETSLDEMKQITVAAHKVGVETEAFIHGAMCISYSGRCLMSDFLTERGSNHGECVQACRWEWQITEPTHTQQPLFLQEDERGTYILNSKDLNMIEHIADLNECGIDSFKIEGRMKSPYYVATVVNAYRRAIDEYNFNHEINVNAEYINELYKTSHRRYTTGFYYKAAASRQCYESSKAVQETEFIATVKSYEQGIATIEMRNRFAVGSELEILSAGKSFNKRFVVESIKNLEGKNVMDAKLVQQILTVPCPYVLYENDILRTISLRE
ncbi:MAG: U32 family peptidase [Clostridia bacterium]